MPRRILAAALLALALLVPALPAAAHDYAATVYAEVTEPEPGVYLFRNKAKVTEVSVSRGRRPSDPVIVQVRGTSYDIGLTDPKRLRGSGGGSDHSGGAAEIRTAMPGKVVRLLIEAGAEIEKGQGVIVVEAMKMQNELKAPKAGTVKEIRVTEGATVSSGEVLAVIE